MFLSGADLRERIPLESVQIRTVHPTINNPYAPDEPPAGDITLTVAPTTEISELRELAFRDGPPALTLHTPNVRLHLGSFSVEKPDPRQNARNSDNQITLKGKGGVTVERLMRVEQHLGPEPDALWIEDIGVFRSIESTNEPHSVDNLSMIFSDATDGALEYLLEPALLGTRLNDAVFNFGATHYRSTDWHIYALRAVIGSDFPVSLQLTYAAKKFQAKRVFDDTYGDVANDDYDWLHNASERAHSYPEEEWESWTTEFGAPATLASIHTAEQQLGLPFSPGLRRFLLRYNGANFCNLRILGVEEIVSHTLRFREEAPEVYDETADDLIVVTQGDLGGNFYVLDTSLTMPDGENPMLFGFHEVSPRMWRDGHQHPSFAAGLRAIFDVFIDLEENH